MEPFLGQLVRRSESKTKPCLVSKTCPMTAGQVDHFSHLLAFTLSPQISLENDYMGPRRIDALKKEDLDWQKKAQEAVLNIQEFTVKYFEITARAQKGRVCRHCVSKVTGLGEYVRILSRKCSGSAGLQLTCAWF